MADGKRITASAMGCNRSGAAHYLGSQDRLSVREDEAFRQSGAGGARSAFMPFNKIFINQ